MKIICTQLFDIKNSYQMQITSALTQLAGAIEYTDCTSAEG